MECMQAEYEHWSRETGTDPKILLKDQETPDLRLIVRIYF